MTEEGADIAAVLEQHLPMLAEPYGRYVSGLDRATAFLTTKENEDENFKRFVRTG